MCSSFFTTLYSPYSFSPSSLWRQKSVALQKGSLDGLMVNLGSAYDIHAEHTSR